MPIEDSKKGSTTKSQVFFWGGTYYFAFLKRSAGDKQSFEADVFNISQRYVILVPSTPYQYLL